MIARAPSPVDVSEGISPLTLLEAILENPAIYELAAKIPQPDPVKGGQPRKYPDFMYIVYEATVSICRSARAAGAMLGHPWVWTPLRERVREMFPDDPSMHLREEPIRRHHWAYIHRTYLKEEKIQSAIATRFRELAAAGAVEIGLLDPEGPGSWTHPHRSRAVYGDGKVITPLYRAKPGDTREDKSTKEIKPLKADPDAGMHFEGGNDEAQHGTKFVMLEARGDEPHTRMILDTEWVPKPGAEGAVAMSCIRRLRPLIPGAQSLVFDMALHGADKQSLLREHCLIPVIKVPAKEAQKKTKKGWIPRIPKDSHVEDKTVRLADGTTKTLRIHAVDGEVGVAEWNEKGKNFSFVQVERSRVRPFQDKDEEWRWYGVYQLPKTDHFGGGGSFTMRLDETEDDRARKFRRTELVSVIPYADKDFKPLFSLRPDAESINRGLEDSLYIGRAHSVGHASQHMNLIGYALMVNSLALYLARRRGRAGLRPPPDAQAA